MKYYDIDEKLAEESKKMWSFSEYKKGSATNEYKNMVDYAYELAEEVPEEYKEKGYQLADKYANQLAKHFNKKFSIDLQCPSMMIAGPSNFPTRKKEKQNQSLDKLFNDYKKIENILEQIKHLKHYKPREEIKRKAFDVDLKNDYFEVIQNEELNRLQLKFDDIPSEEIRNMLKSNGFRWSPKNEAWQRQLTNNAIWATERLIKKLKEVKEWMV